MKEKIRVVVIGFGYLGKWHCDKVAACEDAELVGIVDTDPKHMKIAQNKFPEAMLSDNLETFKENSDAFVIVTPTSTHYKIAKLAMSWNKHVFCEKPLCKNSQEALELSNLAKESGLTCMVGHSERCHEAWEKIEIPNEAYFANLSRVTFFKDRANDVSVIDDLLIHDIDLIHYVLKTKVKELFAVGSKCVTQQYDKCYVYGILQNGSTFNLILFP